ncbi:hypothetical protein D3C85_1458560 [compost metagenome]
MADLRAAIGGEEHQVTGLQRLGIHGWRAHDDHLTRRTRQAYAGSITVDVLDQATAIETGIRRVAAPAIRRAHQADSTHQHVIGNRRRAGLAIGYLRLYHRGRRRRTAGAGSQQGCQGEKCEARHLYHGQNILSESAGPQPKRVENLD